MKTTLKNIASEVASKMKMLGWIDLALWSVPALVITVFQMLGLN
jgi:hypothetical protein